MAATSLLISCLILTHLECITPFELVTHTHTQEYKILGSRAAMHIFFLWEQVRVISCYCLHLSHVTNWLKPDLMERGINE